MRYVDKKEMFENLKVGDHYYKGRVVDFEFETIDDDFPRYTDFNESVDDVGLNQYTDHIDVEFKTLNVEYDLRLDNSMMIVIGELYELDN